MLKFRGDPHSTSAAYVDATLPCTPSYFSIDLVETSTRHTGTIAARLRWADTLANKIGQAAFARAIGEYGSVIFG
jgi:hypothetical protein